jgi:hypothetical protein
MRQSEMEMSEAKRKKCGRSGNEEERGKMRERIN